MRLKQGERSRPGCGSVRPRAEPGRVRVNQTVRIVEHPTPTAKARLAAPEAGALPKPNRIGG